MASTYNVARLGRIAIKSQSAWGTAETSGFTALECEAALPPTGREIHEKYGTTITGGHYYLKPVDGSQFGQEFSITMPLHGWSSAPGVASPADHPEALILASILGAKSLQSYVAAGVSGSGSTSTTLDVLNAGSFASGQAVGFYNTDTTPLFQAGFITETTTAGAPDTLTLSTAFTGSIADSTSVHGANTCYLSTDDITQFFTIEWRSVVNNSRVLLDSCVPSSVELTLGAKGQPMISVTFVCNGMTADDDSADLGATTFSYPTLPAAIGNNSARLVRGTTTATAAHDFSIAISQSLAPRLDHNAASGVAGVVATERTVTCTFNELLTAEPNLSTDTSETRIFLQLGSGAGNTMCVYMPEPVLTAVGDLTDSEGLIAQSKSYQPGSHTQDEGSTAPADTDFRISFL